MVKSILVFFIYCMAIFSQPNAINIYPYQHFIEDSTNVFWTFYPNPFSPPNITDTSKGLMCGQYTFYCSISDTVLLAFQNEKDSIVYTKELYSPSSDFGICLWIAGPKINQNELPKEYFQSNEKEKIKLILIVNGHKKCYREMYTVNRKYYWIR